MKLNIYIFNNAEYDDIILCNEHNHAPTYGMWVHDYIEEDPDNDICCQECTDILRDIFNGIP